MSTALIVNLSGVVLIIAIVWWFWLSSAKTVVVSDEARIDIIVDGGVYTPAKINIKANKNQHLRFIRKDASPCAGTVKFDVLNKSAELPVNKPVDIEVQFDKPGDYEFTCQMGMYRGKIIVT